MPLLTPLESRSGRCGCGLHDDGIGHRGDERLPLFLGFIVLGSIVTRSKVLEFSGLLILGMSFPNILGVALLSGNVKRRLDEYWGRYRELEPVTKPVQGEG